MRSGEYLCILVRVLGDRREGNQCACFLRRRRCDLVRRHQSDALVDAMRASVFIAALAIATASELASKPALTQSRSCIKSTTTATKPLPALALAPPTKHLQGGMTVSAEGLPLVGQDADRCGRHLPLLLGVRRATGGRLQEGVWRRILCLHLDRAPDRGPSVSTLSTAFTGVSLLGKSGLAIPYLDIFNSGVSQIARYGRVERGPPLRLVPDAGPWQVVQDGARDGGRPRARRQELTV